MSSIENIVKDGENYAFTEDDLRDMTEHKYEIIAYEDLEKYDTIDEVLGKNNGAVILFQNESANSGHWVGLWKKDNTIMYFDSYGLNPDDEIQFTKYTMREYNMSGDTEPHLTHLLNKSNYKISPNKVKLQRFKDHSNTCGRWIGWRLRHKDLSHEQFGKLFTTNQHYNPDWFITILTGHFGGFSN